VAVVQLIDSAADLSPEGAVAFMREELSELRDAGQLGPREIEWAVEHLIGSGVGLPDVLGVVFDFAEVEWLTDVEREVSARFDARLLAELARRAGIDPTTGKRVAPAAPTSLAESFPPTCSVQRRNASIAGSEGVRQRPLRGWQR
jgi:hypothetical protein